MFLKHASIWYFEMQDNRWHPHCILGPHSGESYQLLQLGHWFKKLIKKNLEPHKRVRVLAMSDKARESMFWWWAKPVMG